MSQPQSPISSTTPEALRAAISEAVQVDTSRLQSAVGSIQVATSEQLQIEDPQIKSLYDREGRTLTLLVDRIPAGQEAEDFAAALIQHLGHNASMPNAHADAHRDVADARRVLADVAKDTQKVSTSIDQSSQSGEQLVLAISDAALLVEINRRGILRPLYGAIGAMHDHLDRTGALDEHLSQYLTYRLRREEAAITGMPDSAARVANWQECIDQLDREARAVKVEDSPSPGM